MTTKDKIIYEAFKLFSVKGYDMTSTRDISRALGMSDSLIYKHFKNKEEILASIIEESKLRFKKQFEGFDLSSGNWDDVASMSLKMFEFQTGDEWIKMFRKLLIIEQYKNKEMADLYHTYFIELEVSNTKMILDELIKEGYIKNLDSYALAMEFYAPFFLYHTYDFITDEIKDRLRKHIEYFRNNYRVI